MESLLFIGPKTQVAYFFVKKNAGNNNNQIEKYKNILF